MSVRTRLALPMASVLALSATDAWAAELPEDAAALVAAYARNRHDLEAKAMADVAKEAETLAKSLRKIQDREAKANRADAAAAIRASLDELAAYAPAASAAPTPAKAKRTFAEFLTAVQVESSTYQNINGQVTTGVTRMSIDGTYAKIEQGLNVVAIVDGAHVIERTYRTTTHFGDLIKDLEGLPQGALVVMTLMNEIAPTLPEAIDKAFRTVGAGQGILNQGADLAYILIGCKGLRPGAAIELMSRDHVEYPPKKKR
ncbi:MAG: hypothetical protein H0V44_06245 [Planctomycetes bacterium]|nr:hypothetical protein [Planctomycetota bacterium]